MAMFQQFIENIYKQQWRHCKIVVAVSGGLDSMCLALLVHQAKMFFSNSPEGLAGFDFAVAHCNFQLRGEDSNLDAQLVKDWTKELDVQFFQKTFDTKNIIEQEGGNIQIVARKLRYDWFEDLRKELGFDCIATAHHKQDSVETLLINFLNGTGIAGLHGILPEQKRIIRPLLPFRKSDLEAFAIAENLIWREDVSNAKTDYLRNKVRLELIPNIESVFPNAVESLYDNSLRFAEAEMLYQQSIERYRKKLIEQRGKDWYIPLRKLINCKPLASITYELLKPFGLSAKQVPEVLKLIYAATGKFMLIGDYRLLRDRNFFIITKLEAKESHHILIEKEDKEIACNDFNLQLKSSNTLPKSFSGEALEAYVDMGSVEFPLCLRPWREGDYLYPFGMGMRKKKVKKVLTDLKMPLHEKEKVWVLESGKKIVWLCGIRADERFKVKPNSKEILHLQIKPKTD